MTLSNTACEAAQLGFLLDGSCILFTFCSHQHMSEKWRDLEGLTRLIESGAERGGNVRMKSETARTVATHLRLYMNACEPHRELSFKLEQWDVDARAPIHILALFRNIILARECFDSICAAQPMGRFMLRQGIRVIVDSGKPGPETPQNVVRIER